MKNPKINTLAILGDFGTGKTTYSQKLTLESAKNYLDNPLNNYLPIMIDLRSFTHVKNMEELVNNALMWEGIDYKDFLRLFQDGKILLILDGFDEMSPDTRKAISFENFNEVNKLISNESKLLITSRTHYFRQRKDEKSIFKTRDKNFTGISAKDDKGIRIVYLEGFYEEDIEIYLKLYFKNEWKRYHERLRSIYDLSGLAHRPILLNLIVQTLPELDDCKGEITQDMLYDIYIDRWTKREEWRDVKSEDVLLLMEELAFKMFISNRISITPQELMEIIRDKYKQKILIGLVNLEDFDGKIRTASFLYRDKDDNYSFMHKSFMEFFVAKKFAKEIERGNINVDCFGKVVLTPEIAYFLKDLVKDRKKLYGLIEFTKGKSFEQVLYLGGNAATILKLQEATFNGKDFSMAVLVGANLSNSDLIDTNFSGSILKQANLTNTILKSADFSFSDLEGARLEDIVGINYIAWSPDGKYIASGGDDTFVRIWATKTCKECAMLKGHKSSVKCLCWSPDCSILVSGSSDKNIIIWDTHTWKLITTLKFHNNEVVSLTWNKNENYLISGDSNGQIITWDVDKAWNIVDIVTKKGRINRLKFINSLNYLVVSSEKGIVILEGDTYNQVLQLCNFSSIYEIDEKNNSLVYVAHKLVKEYQTTDYSSLYNPRRVYKKYNKELIQFNTENFVSEKIKSWTNEELSVTEEDEHTHFGTFEDDTIYEIVDISHGNKKNNLAIILYNYDHWYEPDGDTTANEHEYYLIFFYGKRELKSILIGERRSKSEWDGLNKLHPFTIIEYSNDDKYLAIGGRDKTIKIWDAAPESPNFGKCLYTIKQLINCQSMNIRGINGLTKDQIKFLKEGGAVEI